MERQKTYIANMILEKKKQSSMSCDTQLQDIYKATVVRKVEYCWDEKYRSTKHNRKLKMKYNN